MENRETVRMWVEKLRSDFKLFFIVLLELLASLVTSELPLFQRRYWIWHWGSFPDQGCYCIGEGAKSTHPSIGTTVHQDLGFFSGLRETKFSLLKLKWWCWPSLGFCKFFNFRLKKAANQSNNKSRNVSFFGWNFASTLLFMSFWFLTLISAWLQKEWRERTDWSPTSHSCRLRDCISAVRLQRIWALPSGGRRACCEVGGRMAGECLPLL